MSISKKLKIIGVGIGVFTVIFSFQNCTNQTGSLSSSSTTRPSGMGVPVNPEDRSMDEGNSDSPAPIPVAPSQPTPSEPAPSQPAPGTKSPSITIFCPAKLQELNTATCSTVLVGNFSQGSWFVDGVEVQECRDQAFCTWREIQKGTYNVKAIAYDAADNNRAIVSNEVSVTVSASSDPVSTPATVYCNKELNAQQTVTCNVVISKDVVSGYWEVNGQRYSGCDDKTSCTWANVPAGTYTVGVKVKRSAGADYSSPAMTVIAR